MATVVLGPAGTLVMVDLGVCVKTGQVTDQRAVLSGRARPTWVTVLLVFTVIGFLLAEAMTSRGYRLDLPFSHAVHDRWRRQRRLAWVVGLVGTVSVIVGATSGAPDGDRWVWLGCGVLAVAVAIGTINATRNNIGVHLTRDNDLVLTRVHPAFAEAAEAAVTEPLTRGR